MQVGDHIFWLDQKIHSGFFGQVWKGRMVVRESVAPVIIKTWSKDHEHLARESIMQKVLACEDQHLRMLGAAVVPDIHLTARNSVSKAPFAVMQALETTLEEFVHVNKHNLDRLGRGLRVMLRSVAAALKHLQKKYLFEHRDLHCGNIMVQGAAVFIIDFGRARFVSDQTVIETGEWEKSGGPRAQNFDAGRDLLYLCCSLCHRLQDLYAQVLPPFLHVLPSTFGYADPTLRFHYLMTTRGEHVDGNVVQVPSMSTMVFTPTIIRSPSGSAVPIPPQLWYPDALLQALPS